MQRSSGAGLLMFATLCFAACSDLTGTGAGCGVEPAQAFNVITRDQLGTGQALGATATFIDLMTDSTDSVYRTDDSLTDYGGVHGRYYDIHVTKPWYTDGWARHVRYDGNECGLGFLKIPIVITVLPGAPPIRQMHLLPEGILLDLGAEQTQARFTPFIDANPGISHAVRWSVSGDLGNAGFDYLSGGLTYHCQSQSTSFTITVTLIADTTFSASSAVRVQGRPTSASDSSCR